MLAAIQPAGTTEQSLTQAAWANRLLLTGTLTGTILMWLATVYAYLKIDHATRGFYSGRLQTVAVVTSLLVLLISIVFYLVWMQV